jgi:hypothetical protein
MNHGLMMALSIDWNAPTKVVVGVPQPGHDCVRVEPDDAGHQPHGQDGRG